MSQHEQSPLRICYPDESSRFDSRLSVLVLKRTHTHAHAHTHTHRHTPQFRHSSTFKKSEPQGIQSVSEPFVLYFTRKTIHTSPITTKEIVKTDTIKDAWVTESPTPIYHHREKYEHVKLLTISHSVQKPNDFMVHSCVARPYFYHKPNMVAASEAVLALEIQRSPFIEIYSSLLIVTVVR